MIEAAVLSQTLAKARAAEKTKVVRLRGLNDEEIYIPREKVAGVVVEDGIRVDFDSGYCPYVKGELEDILEAIGWEVVSAERDQGLAAEEGEEEQEDDGAHPNGEGLF